MVLAELIENLVAVERGRMSLFWGVICLLGVSLILNPEEGFLLTLTAVETLTFARTNLE